MKNVFYEFLHSHNIFDEMVYDYYLSHSFKFDYYNDDYLLNFIGCNYVVDKNNILREINSVVPNIVDDVTTLINIHEYVHTLCSYKYLNKKFKLSNYCEVLPIFYEKLYVMELNNDKLNKYEEFLDQSVIRNSDDRYNLALNLFDKLLLNYDYDKIGVMNSKTKKLSKNTIKFYVPST